jgi:hypothetical protein
MMFASMNSHWQNVRKECGQWPFTLNGISYTGSHSSSNCATTNSNLIANAIYYQKDGSALQVDSKFTDSVNVRLWSNALLA